ncbi:hypothetical protein [Oceanobacillus senegalensis]|uniref:hypothetical protein n=1 Tax=Oceanobacillus senegalensis TaxID=1936063 RepID=UPI00117E2235|nr:hypothetical protein [Oceanobacillus senegalensis]
MESRGKSSNKKVNDELKQKLEAEDYFYLKRFENKVGKITERKEAKSGICTYQIEFDQNHSGYFYNEDMEE